MNWVTFVWALSVGACVILGLTHLLIWLRNRSAWAQLAFSAAALSIGAVAVGELLLMFSSDPEAYGRILRWMHVPVLVLFVALVAFVHFYFGTARIGLGLAVLVVRAVSLILNFIVPVNLHFREIRSLAELDLFGQTIRVVGEATNHHWSRVAELSSLLLLVYVIDASIRLWRRGGREDRGRALRVGGSIVLFVLFGAGHSILISLRLIEFPIVLSFCFLGILLAMAFQLSSDAGDATRLAEELRESQDQMSLASSAAGMVLWTWNIPENRIWVTSEVKNLYGVDPDEVVTVERFLGTVHPVDRAGLEESMAASIASHGDFARDYRVVLPDGEIRWISARGRVEVDPGNGPRRMRGVSIDTTERRLADDRARSLIEAAPWGILLVDDAMRIVQANREANAIFGYAPGELIGGDLGVLLPERFRERHAMYFQAFLREPTSRSMGAGRELSGVRRDGSEFPIEVSLAPVETGSGRHVLASISDVMERRLAEHEAAKQRETLAHLSRVNSLGMLSASLAHELNQPLGIILSNAQAAQSLLNREQTDLAQIRAIIDDIVREDQRAAESIQRLRSLFQQGKGVRDSVDLTHATNDLLRLMNRDLERRGVRVRTESDGSIPKVSVDPVQIRQVLLNLILNACDAVEGLDSSCREIVIRFTASEEAVGISVADRGKGLTKESEEQIFTPFYSTKESGLGVGLAVSRAIIAAHHGRIWAEGAEGGTVFYCELPVRPDTTPS